MWLAMPATERLRCSLLAKHAEYLRGVLASVADDSFPNAIRVFAQARAVEDIYFDIFGTDVPQLEHAR